MIIDYFWAKKSSKDGVLKWLPLSQHLDDTTFIIGRLWENWLDDSQRFTVEKTLEDPDDGKRLAMFLAYTHDLGKATASFQTRRGYMDSKDLDLELLYKLDEIGIQDAREIFLSSPEKTHHSLASQVILESFGIGRDVAVITGAHHGKSPDTSRVIENQLRSYSANYYNAEYPNNDNIFKKAQREIIDRALEVSGFSSAEEIPSVPINVQMILSGLLIMADWIASNEGYFPLIEIDQYVVEDSETRKQIGWSKWHKGSTWIPRIYDVHSMYKNRFDFDGPREEQEKFFNVLENIADPGIIIFEAPMGMGKTESALIGVEQLAEKSGKSGLFFGLPTQATSNGIFPRINDSWLNSISKDQGEKLPIRLSHGKASLNENFRQVATNIYEEEGSGTFVNQWFSGNKTSALDDFVVGTVDNFLLMSLKQKHLFLRHLGFSKKVIVIDEAHAYDTYSSEYLNRSVEWAGAVGSPIIVLSATLPGEKRRDLIGSYLAGKGVDIRKVEAEGVDFMTSSYPVITYTDGESIGQFTDFDVEHRHQVKIIKEKSENLIPLVKSLAKDGGIIGVVVNTVRRAQELGRELIEIYKDDVEVLHSSYIATDRAKKEVELLNTIGDPDNRPRFKIIVGTQVIEQSLDIDFDVMISDLAPMDLMIQRLGRLHRHDENDKGRPVSKKDPVFYVLDTSDSLDFDPGSVAVYDGYTLTRSQYYLPEHINIPEDISPLVQRVYSNEEIQLDEELIPIYKRYKEKFEIFNKKKRSRARGFLLRDTEDPNKYLPFEMKKDNLTGMFSTMKDLTGMSEEKSLAQVRDIKDTIEVIAVKEMGDGYSLLGENVDISELIQDPEVARKVAQSTLRLPGALSYDPVRGDKVIEILERYNLKYLSEWQETSWLKGSLGIIFDEKGEFVLDGIKLIYDEKLGLTYEGV